MRGAISAGMCVVLETAGLVSAFDRIYGVSAGALNGCATATGQAALSATHYQDAASRRVVNLLRPLVRQPVIDFDLLFKDVIAARKPLHYERLATGPEFRSLATSIETLTLRVLRDFAHANELLQAVRVSAALPRLGGDAPAFRGERMIDGAMIEPIPFETALAEGASHVLVLRSRPAGYRKSTYGGLVDSLALGGDRRVAELIRAGHAVYNRQATWLEQRETCAAAEVLQVAVPDEGHGVTRLRADSRGIVDALRLGARTMASAVLVEPIDLCWQPVVCRATTAGAADHVRLAPATARAL
jgi:predicted acylesterase/phospholipase RssA